MFKSQHDNHLYQCFQSNCTLPDFCSLLGAAACADVLYRRTPPTTTTTTTTPGPVSQASSLILITTTVQDFTFYFSSLNRSRHFKVVNLVSGVDVLHSHRHEKVITGTAGGPCTPTGQHCYPAALVHTHLHQINACPLILAGPFITFLTASVQPQKQSPGKEAEQR